MAVECLTYNEIDICHGSIVGLTHERWHCNRKHKVVGALALALINRPISTGAE